MRIDLHCLKCEFDDFKLFINPEGITAECHTCAHPVSLKPDLVAADEFGMLFLYDEKREGDGKLLSIMDGDRVEVTVKHYDCPLCGHVKGRRRVYGPDSVPRAYIYCPACKRETSTEM